MTDVNTDMNYVAIVVAAMLAFVVSSVWYTVLGAPRVEPSGANADAAAEMEKPAAWKLLFEFVRSLIVAAVLAGIAAQSGIVDWTDAVLLGVSVWIGFPVMILAGAVIWENYPWKLAARHVGDWLAKLVVIAIIVGVWH